MDIAFSFYDSPCGRIILGDYDGRLCLCDWEDRRDRDQIDKRLQKGLCAVFVLRETELISDVKIQLDEYFLGTRKDFNVPFCFVGTEFQRSVWGALGIIGYGEIMSYGALADRIGNPKAVRALGSAVGANVLSILVPCHRVLGKNGAMTGYAGGLDAKKFLIELEQN